MKKYQISNFEHTEFMTAKEKLKAVNNLISFLKNGCKETQFTKALYNHLHLHLSFIAHYDRYTFWQTYFQNPADNASFVEQVIRGGYTSDYNDVNFAFKDIVREWWSENKGVVEHLVRHDDLETAKNLMRKHGVSKIELGIKQENG